MNEAINCNQVESDKDRKTRFWFKNELESVKVELSEAIRQLESYSTKGFNFRLYGLPIFMASTFFTLLGLIAGSRVSMDYFTLMCILSATWLIVLLWRNNYLHIEGPDGHINYLADRVRLLERARDAGNIIDEFDTEAQENWLTEFIRDKGKKMPDDHPFHELDRILSHRTIIFSSYIILTFMIALTNFLANLSLQLSETLKIKSTSLGLSFELLPEWGQWIWFNSPVLAAPIVYLLALAILIVADIHNNQKMY